jgi:hypothetical protein
MLGETERSMQKAAQGHTGQGTQEAKTMSLGAINRIALTVAALERSVPFYDCILHFLGYRPSKRQDDYMEWEGPCGWFMLRAAREGSKNRPHDRYGPDSTTSPSALRAGNRLTRSIGDHPPRRAGVRRWPRAAAGATGSTPPLGLSEAGSPGSQATRAESAAIT